MLVIEYKPIILAEKKTDKEDEIRAVVLTGIVKIQMPKYKERVQLIKSMNFTVKDGKVEAAAGDYAGLADKMADIVAKHVQEIDLEHVPSGKKFSKLEELEPYKEFQDLVMDVGGVIMAGVSLGNA